MKRNTTVTRVIDQEAGLERLIHLEARLAPTPAESPLHRELSAAIRVEADAYRKSLDVEQAAATHDPRPGRTVRSKPFGRSSATRKLPVVVRTKKR